MTSHLRIEMCLKRVGLSLSKIQMLIRAFFTISSMENLNLEDGKLYLLKDFRAFLDENCTGAVLGETKKSWLASACVKLDVFGNCVKGMFMISEQTEMTSSPIWLILTSLEGKMKVTLICPKIVNILHGDEWTMITSSNPYELWS